MSSPSHSAGIYLYRCHWFSLLFSCQKCQYICPKKRGRKEKGVKKTGYPTSIFSAFLAFHISLNRFRLVRYFIKLAGCLGSVGSTVLIGLEIKPSTHQIPIWNDFHNESNFEVINGNWKSWRSVCKCMYMWAQSHRKRDLPIMAKVGEWLGNSPICKSQFANHALFIISPMISYRCLLSWEANSSYSHKRALEAMKSCKL